MQRTKSGLWGSNGYIPRKAPKPIINMTIKDAESNILDDPTLVSDYLNN